MSWRDLSLLWVGLAVTGLILVGLRSHSVRRRRLADFLGGRRALERMSRADLARVGVRRGLLLGLAGVALSVAAAGPYWPRLPERQTPVKRVVLAIDVSASMQATDVAPTRLAGAVAAASDMIDALEGQQVGLLLFAGTAYPLAPPTLDHHALHFLLDGVAPTVASAQDPGTRLAIAIEQSVALLRRGAPADGDAVLSEGSERAAPSPPVGEELVVLVGDGDTSEPDEDLREALALARDEGIGVHTVGVGTDEGSRMTMPSGLYQLGGPVVDASGVRAVSRRREGVLRDVAGRGGGRYVALENEPDVAALRAELAQPLEAPEPVQVEGVPPWARDDLPFLLGALALVLVAAESLVGVALPRLRAVRFREST